MAQIVLWLFVIVLGIDFGAGLYEARIEVPQWLVWSAEQGGYFWDAAAARQADVGRKFWAFASTGSLTLLTLVGFFFVRQVGKPARSWWMKALWIALIERLFTFSYFIPTMIGLMAPDVTSTPEVVATAILWMRLNGIRHLLIFAAWLASLKAMVTLQTSS